MKKLVLSLLIVSALASCSKKVNELPPATQTGANTFGAKINGEMWVPKAFGPITGAAILEVRILAAQDYYIYARNYASSPTETEIELFLKGVTGPGVYPLASDVNYPNATASYGYYIKRRVNPLEEYITTSTHTGSVTITKVDLIARIISGTFQFTAREMTDPSKQIVISEGRFDAKIP